MRTEVRNAACTTLNCPENCVLRAILPCSVVFETNEMHGLHVILQVGIRAGEITLVAPKHGVVVWLIRIPMFVVRIVGGTTPAPTPSAAAATAAPPWPPSGFMLTPRRQILRLEQ